MAAESERSAASKTGIGAMAEDSGRESWIMVNFDEFGAKNAWAKKAMMSQSAMERNPAPRETEKKGKWQKWLKIKTRPMGRQDKAMEENRHKKKRSREERSPNTSQAGRDLMRSGRSDRLRIEVTNRGLR